MGRSKKKKKKWTLEEEQRLIKLCEDNPQTEVARKMRRSVSSVKNKRISMNIPSYSDSTDKLKISEVARLVGIDYQSITRTWVKYGFEIDKTGVFSLVTEDVLIKFMQEHTELWKASDCDYYFFYRFPWFIEKLKNERKGKTPFEQKELNMKIAKYRTYYNECLDIANHLLARHKGVA